MMDATLPPLPALRVREISERWLRRRGACRYQRERYRATFGDAPVPITPAIIRRAAEAKLNLDWVARLVLTPGAWDEYMRARARPWEEFRRACADACEEYSSACERAWAEFDRSCSRAQDECDGVIARARDEYLRAIMSAREVCDRAIDLADVAYDRARVEALIRIVWGSDALDE